MQMLAYRLKSMAGSPAALAPGVSHGLPTGGPVSVGSTDGVGVGDGLGVGDGDSVPVGVGDGL